jgi:hypothetical protein
MQAAGSAMRVAVLALLCWAAAAQLTVAGEPCGGLPRMSYGLFLNCSVPAKAGQQCTATCSKK